MNMNQFYTTVEMPQRLPRFSQRDRLLLMGSCFATHIGTRLVEAKFACDVNPYGVLYNPMSISAALREAMDGKLYAEKDLYAYGDLWHSPMHHGDFSAPSVSEALERINTRLKRLHTELKELDVLVATWGTAWVYEDAETGSIVGNCHKKPERCFRRRRLAVEEVVNEWLQLLATLRKLNPQIKVLLTVSPIRHLRDGLHANQLSKAALLLAADQLVEAMPDVVGYFPAYELLVDELRDYRFYATDMVHPSEVAVNYVWQRFCEACLTDEARLVMDECDAIHKDLSHKPFRPESDGYKKFLEQILLKIDRLNEKYPYLDFEKERTSCRIRLNK